MGSSTLPIARIKTIMKSCPDVETIGHDASVIVGRATELFISHLAVEAYKKSAGKKLDYKDIAEIVQTDDRLDFLREMVPRKITVREFKELLKRKNRRSKTEEVNGSNGNGENSDSSSSEESSDDDDDESESSEDSEHSTLS
ncbi:DNA polymerase epsilon subunit C [Chrysoperla carnea]|uniref:DNA polymerase epsilon subunit C n=1 Tax=Chrysoperla carnea TaxID=189513 RepID=UPI001D082BC7|nr:DNA polymerase epsilon subunit C [Chrysoperla carnea]